MHFVCCLCRLSQLGLRSTASQETLLEAARFIERLGQHAQQGAQQAQQHAQQGGGGDGYQMEMAVARGKVRAQQELIGVPLACPPSQQECNTHLGAPRRITSSLPTP